MKIGVLGYGVVAKAVIKQLSTSGFNNSGLSVVKILRRRGKATGPLMVEDPQEILEDDKIDVVVELMGGIHPAYEYLRASLNAGKHVITANKALINHYGDELSALARKRKVGLLLSAACGGGIPIQPTILENKPLGIKAISGILNGTTNYILDEMESHGVDYAHALKQAQKLGYAEADPSSDVDGIDSLYKIRLALAVGMNTWIDIESILVEGISHIHKEDIHEIQKLGLKIRLIAQGKMIGKGYEMSVEPCLVAMSSAYARTLQNYNLAIIHPIRGNDVYLSGQGAGGKATATNVVRDLLYTKAGQKEMLPSEIKHLPANQSKRMGQYLIRTRLDCTAFKDIEDHFWISNNLQYILTKPMHSLELHQRIKTLRETEAIFFAKLEVAR